MPEQRTSRFLRIAYALCLLAAMAGTPAHAQDASEDLDQVLDQKSEAEQRARKLADQAGKLAAEAADLSGRLKQTATQVRAAESRFDKLEAEAAELEQLIDGLTATMAARRVSIAQSLSALAGLSGVPPLAAIARPGETEEIRLAASALAGLRPGLAAQVRRMNADRAALRQHRDDLRTARAAAADELVDLQNLKGRLDKLTSQKRALVRKTRTGAANAAEQARQLARRAEDLTALLKQLQQLEQMEPVQTAIAAPARAPARFSALKGSLPLPVQGALHSRFGDISGINRGSGVLVRVRPGALVTAPHDAIVRFAGPFRSYGDLLILDFSDDYHLLVAGLAGMDVVVGQWLLAGEPVGSMGSTKADLYLELRHRGVPVDPEPWLARR